MATDLAVRLKKRADQLGFSDAEVARRAGIPTRNYSHIIGRVIGVYQEI